MSKKTETDLENTRTLFAMLQGECPDGCVIAADHMPKLTPDQAWTVIWWLGNRYWQPSDNVERCDVCGYIFHADCEGACLDYGHAPYHFCDSCLDSDEYRKKARIGRRLERAQKRSRLSNTGAERR